MTNFTKGPWVVKYNGGETQLIADGECIMSDMTYYPWVPENTADWHLIAAAPDMYEALRMARDEIEGLEYGHFCERSSSGSFADWIKDNDTLPFIDAVLAKTHGV